MRTRIKPGPGMPAPSKRGRGTVPSVCLVLLLLALAAAVGACAPQESDDAGRADPVEGLRAFVGARIIDGTGGAPIESGVVVVRDGRIEAIGADDTVDIPGGAELVRLDGRTIFPGMINTHGHVGDTVGLQGGNYSEENVLDHLALYARYGVTTVNSLGGDQALAADVRAAESAPGLDRARLLFAGPVVAGETAEEVRTQIDEIAPMGVDFIKIRVDDNLGRNEKMSPEVYQAAIDAAHEHGLRLASHLFYLEDAKGLLRAGTDFVAHSVRDQPVDQELIDLLVERDVCYCPTLTREISTFVYERVPDFFADPFFLKDADAEVIEALKDPDRQQRYQTPQAQRYKEALRMAQANLKVLADGGVTIAMGTDSGPPARFQGYFEHLELELMAQAGLTPMQILVSATGDAAACLGLDELGTLEAGKWADFVVVTANPLDDIDNTRTVESVWIAGNRVPDGS